LQAFFCVALIAAAPALPARGRETGCALQRRALVIGLDGTRGDVLHDLVWNRGEAPALRDLMARGAYARCPAADSGECARAQPTTPVRDRTTRSRSPSR
jgi:hypothetical protein